MKNPSDSPPRAGVQIYVPPKLASVLIAVLIGTGVGGLGGVKWFNGSGAEGTGHISTHPNRNPDYDVRFQTFEDAQTVHTKKIGALEDKTEEIQSVQHKDIARQEARRLTKDIPNRERREREYDRLFGLNMSRLKGGREPCANLRCTN